MSNEILFSLLWASAQDTDNLAEQGLGNGILFTLADHEQLEGFIKLHNVEQFPAIAKTLNIN